MPLSTDDLDIATTSITNSLDAVSKAIQQHATALRQNSSDLRRALRILCTVTDSQTSKLVITGIGKSFHIGKKLAATLTSIGTRAVSLHATEALHGDLGIIGHGDCVLALSYSGETDEVVALASVIHSMRTQEDPMHVWMIGMGKSHASELGALCDAWIACPVDAELSQVGAPTVSSSLMLAIGDAVAVMLMERRRFGPRDFARYHPGGALGGLSRKAGDAPVVCPVRQTCSPPMLELDGNDLR
ncbi:hypothetical protein IWW43_006678 [Coemansia sp. RSA 1935]|nr:hypothetical protein GGH97_001620 [Coemansia sp. RSA 475]KAJ2525761.1 hypothetical protein IWW43_006678 [Coemansia sp. RSA 1935]